MILRLVVTKDWKKYTMRLETDRMIIREFMQSDVDDLQEILGDDITMENCEPPYEREKTQHFLTEFCMDKSGAVAAVQRNSGKVIGYILFKECQDAVYEMGWIFNRNFWRQGFAFEACKAVIDYAFEVLKARKIFAETIDTVKSVKIMQKLGMQPEGVQKSQTKDTFGNYADLYFYGIMEENWRRNR